ncbi:hypothetical protein QL285_057529 [Trifolium repens]|nr:hypothetical protein QL285_057529 [Trifolium repens]
MKKASGSKKEIKKEATTSRSRKNRQPKQIIKQEVATTAESDETDSDYAEFLRTYDPEKESSDSENNYIILLDSASSAGLSETEESKKEESEAKPDVESK